MHCCGQGSAHPMPFLHLLPHRFLEAKGPLKISQAWSLHVLTILHARTNLSNLCLSPSRCAALSTRQILTCSIASKGTVKRGAVNLRSPHCKKQANESLAIEKQIDDKHPFNQRIDPFILQRDAAKLEWFEAKKSTARTRPWVVANSKLIGHLSHAIKGSTPQASGSDVASKCTASPSCPETKGDDGTLSPTSQRCRRAPSCKKNHLLPAEGAVEGSPQQDLDSPINHGALERS